MSKPRPKSQSKARKRSPAEGKIAAKASMEERKSFSQFVLEFFLPLLSRIWELGRKLFSFGPSEENKEPSLLLERPDAAPSSSALATPSGVNIVAERASGEQTEGLAGEILIFGTVNVKDPSPDPNSTGHSNEAWKPDPEVLEAVFSSNGVMVGKNFCPYQAVCRRSYEEPAKLLRVIEDDEIKFKWSGSGSGYRMEEHDDLKKKHEAFDRTVVLRQVYSDFEKTEECEVMNNELKKEALKVLKREKGENRNFKMVVRKTPFTKLLRTMFNMALENSYCFPHCSNPGEKQWWEENFHREILEDRLKILREAAKNWNSKRDIFLVVELVTELNSKLHPQTNEKDKVEMFTLANTIYSLRSGGDSKI